MPKIDRNDLKKNITKKDSEDENYENVEIKSKRRNKEISSKKKEFEAKKQLEIEKLELALKEAELNGWDKTEVENKLKNVKNTPELDRNKLKKLLDKDKRGVVVYVHPKPYPDYAWPWETSRDNNYISKINYEVIGRDNPYAKVDENLRQLKLYNNNDVKPYYNVSRDHTTGELRSEKNMEKKEPHRFNQYVSKEIIIYPNKKGQTHMPDLSKKIGGKKRRKTKIRGRKTKNKNRQRRNKTKRNKKI